MSANARTARIAKCKAQNPTYSMSSLGDGFSLGESVAYVVLLGDKKAATVRRSWLEFLFEHEQLPLHLGWRRADTSFEQGDLDVHMQTMRNLTAAPAAGKPGKRAMHFGW